MRIDERTIMFSRMGRTPGTSAFNDYYNDHPEHKSIDDHLRAMPHMNEPGRTMYDPLNSPMIDSAFQFLGDIKHLVDGPQPANQRVPASPETFTKRLKGLAAHYGAVLTGIAEKDASYYYSHRGRRDENYGEPVVPVHPYTFVFAVEMEQDLIYSAPRLTQTLAVGKGYVDAAVIGMMLTYYIKTLGYEARNHMDGNFLMVMPLAAKAAGLGDLGRHGLLINETYGSRIRLGAVTTDLPLITDAPSALDVHPFCEICGKCVKTCPAQAISGNPAQTQEGQSRWQIQQEKCYEKWRILGTDCGICLATCPFSSSLPQELIAAYKRDPEQGKLLLAAHEAHYPIRPFNKDTPEWLK